MSPLVRDYDIAPLKSLRIDYVLAGNLRGTQTLLIDGERVMVETKANSAGKDTGQTPTIWTQEVRDTLYVTLYNLNLRTGKRMDNVRYYQKQKLAQLARADREYYRKFREQNQLNEMAELLGMSSGKPDTVSFLNHTCLAYRGKGVDLYLFKGIIVKMKVPLLGFDMEAIKIVENPRLTFEDFHIPATLPYRYDAEFSKRARAGIDSLVVKIKQRRLGVSARTPPLK